MTQLKTGAEPSIMDAVVPQFAPLEYYSRPQPWHPGEASETGPSLVAQDLRVTTGDVMIGMACQREVSSLEPEVEEPDTWSVRGKLGSISSLTDPIMQSTVWNESRILHGFWWWMMKRKKTGKTRAAPLEPDADPARRAPRPAFGRSCIPPLQQIHWPNTLPVDDGLLLLRPLLLFCFCPSIETNRSDGACPSTDAGWHFSSSTPLSLQQLPSRSRPQPHLPGKVTTIFSMADDPLTVDPDFYETDSAYSPDELELPSIRETASIGSSIYRGFMQNGRRYQSLRDKEYCVPSDEQQFETYEAGHLVDLILDSDRDNPLFRSPIGLNRSDSIHVLDIGTGAGTWAIDVADMFPNSTDPGLTRSEHVVNQWIGIVHGIDLYPPPVSWVPPNCRIEVDDVLQEWTWRESFDLIHMRNMLGSFDEAEWARVYQQCFDKLKPGGWIEQLEVGPFMDSDDDTLPPDSMLATWGPYMQSCGARAGRSCDVILTMSSSIRRVGFVDIHEKVYKWPIGPWPRDQRIKEAGIVNLQHWMAGMEGWCMWLLTKFGAPKPWSKEQVYVYCAQLRSEMKNQKYHVYHKARRVWARKPMPGEAPRDGCTVSTSDSPKESS
ncbi:uncharacterized protein N7459_004944 [Penicillium hispanicum]|uniref:uncharacterized protein n=1 Tax=Penicillium hispanicum TaxID=1080232 RepID=UPI00254108F4|nr:uncharacterized protein N7459_004944 [Penicillium hispanicum]KAJ5585144.1 hypothetical protein N7459_004944 [Penicillium hispanicum]